MTRWRIVVALALLGVVAGMVAVYHPGRNPVLGTVALGQGSYMLAVDARSGRALVADGNRVHALDTATGKLVRTVTGAPSPASVRANLLVVDEQMGRAVVLTKPFRGSIPLMGSVGVRDARSGQLLHTTSVALGNTNWLVADAQ